MLILLPPSEGKRAPGSGAKIAMSALGYPSLKKPRQEVFDSLIELCDRHPAKASTALGLGPKQRHLVAVNAGLREAPTAEAFEVYSGVLYEALDFGSLPTAARKRADSRIAIASALFGLLRPSDPIPAYRLSADTTVPRLGTLTSVWRDAISDVLAAAKGPILDLRSGAYVGLGPIPQAVAHASFVGRVLLEKAGKRTVVSHHNKATKGRLVRAVLQQAKVPTKADAVPAFLTSLGFASEVREPKKASDPLGLDIIVYET